jgi:hypothetical protein
MAMPVAYAASSMTGIVNYRSTPAAAKKNEDESS